jgi:hypothetical protein
MGRLQVVADKPNKLRPMKKVKLKGELSTEKQIEAIWKVFNKFKEPGALYYNDNGSPLKKITPVDGVHFQLDELQKYVVGLIEVIRLHQQGLPEKYLIVNEGGKVNGMSVNHLATGVFSQYYGNTNVIFGPAIVCDIAQMEVISHND